MRAKLNIKQPRIDKRGQAMDYKTNKSILETHKCNISKQAIEQTPLSEAFKILMGHSFIADSQPVNEVTKQP
jgi:hypothetical protein